MRPTFVLLVSAHFIIMLLKREEKKIEIYKHVMRTLSEHTMSSYVTKIPLHMC
jgi:hypothetical protein